MEVVVKDQKTFTYNSSVRNAVNDLQNLHKSNTLRTIIPCVH